MTTNSENNNSRWAYTGDGSTTDFSYDNKIFTDADLKVYVDAVLQTLTTDYTVTNAGVATGGNVQFVTAPADTTEVVIVRDVEATQQSDYVDGEDFPAATIEDDFDRAIIVVQQILDDLSRTLRLADSDATASLSALPAKAERLGKVLGFDATNGDPEMLTPNSDTYITLTSFMETLLDDTSAAAARATLGLRIGTDVQADLAVPSQAEAEAGTATTERVWTAQRVKQAVMALGPAADVQEFTSSGTWTKPSRGSEVLVISVGAGGGGARRSSGNAGGGGPGGLYHLWYDIDDLGASESVTIGSGGAVQSTDSTAGNNGGNNAFGAHFTHYGGRGGEHGAGSSNVSGGGGGALEDIWTAGADDQSGWTRSGAGYPTATSLKNDGGAATGATSGNAAQTWPLSIEGPCGGAGHSTTGSASGVAGNSTLYGDGGNGNHSGAGANGGTPGGGGGSGTTQGGSGGDGYILVITF